jgi:hypothetical protein
MGDLFGVVAVITHTFALQTCCNLIEVAVTYFTRLLHWVEQRWEILLTCSEMQLYSWCAVRSQGMSGEKIPSFLYLWTRITSLDYQTVIWLVVISNSNPMTLNLLGADKTALFYWTKTCVGWIKQLNVSESPRSQDSISQPRDDCEWTLRHPLQHPICDIFNYVAIKFIPIFNFVNNGS